MHTNPEIMCRLDGPEVAAFKNACIDNKIWGCFSIISLIVLPLTKCSRLIRAIVSTTSIPLTTRSNPKRAACYGQQSGGQFWTPIPQLRGSNLHAE